MKKAEQQRRNKIIYELLVERQKQDKKWGEQNHPSVDQTLTNRKGGCSPQRMCEEYGILTEDAAKFSCDMAAQRKQLTFAHIVAEEFSEVVSAPDDKKRREELIQLGACVVQWIEAIDRREANKWKKAAKKKTVTKKLKKV